nr:putative reverse transcriptase domain-containing protein [Tanacetum cinerariifolium]
MTIQSSVKDGILATPSESSKVENTPAEMLRDLDQQMEKRANDAQSKALRQENVVTEQLHGLDQQMEKKEDESLYFMVYIWFHWRKPVEFEVGEHVLLKVSPWKGVICFGKKGKLPPRKPFKTTSLDELSSPEFDLFSDLEEQSEEEITEAMGKQWKNTCARPEELSDNTFSRSDHEDENEHIEKVLEIVDLFHILEITQDQIMLRAFPMSCHTPPRRKHEA